LLPRGLSEAAAGAGCVIGHPVRAAPGELVPLMPLGPVDKRGLGLARA
jgi:hypothetical protein